MKKNTKPQKPLADSYGTGVTGQYGKLIRSYMKPSPPPKSKNKKIKLA